MKDWMLKIRRRWYHIDSPFSAWATDWSFINKRNTRRDCLLEHNCWFLRTHEIFKWGCPETISWPGTQDFSLSVENYRFGNHAHIEGNWCHRGELEHPRTLWMEKIVQDRAFRISVFKSKGVSCKRRRLKRNSHRRWWGCGVGGLKKKNMGVRQT